jgi:hypothetical protein
MRGDPLSPKQAAEGFDVMGAAHDQDRPRVQLNYAPKPAAPTNPICGLYFGIDLMRIENGREGGGGSPRPGHG